MITYIHKRGCDCTRFPEVPYVDRLSWTRHAEASMTGEGGNAVGWDEACVRYPDGCCLAWYEGEGWPGTHVDHHLMALWQRAIDSHTADKALDTAQTEAIRADLTEAIYAARHGAQPDGSFITDRRLTWDGERCATLHAPGKGGPLVSVVYGGRGRTYLSALRTRVEARAIRDADRAQNRAAEREHANLCASIDAHLASGLRVYYEPGQMFGTFMEPGISPLRVSARGACKRAGIELSALPRAAGWWHLPGLEVERFASRSALPARARRLRATERRAVMP